jgi:glutamine amidotransferase
MCRLLGVTQFDMAKHRELVEAFIGLSITGKTLASDPPGHLDGWGIGYYADGKAHTVKSGGSLWREQARLVRVLEAVRRSPVVILHLRKSAWKQTSVTRHAHPFKKGQFLFAHNGTVRDYPVLTAALPARCRPSADALDTEVFFRYLVRDGFPRDTAAFAAAVEPVHRERAYSSLTCLLASADRLFAYRDFHGNGGYYTLYQGTWGASRIFASEPIARRIPWSLLPQGAIVAAGPCGQGVK